MQNVQCMEAVSGPRDSQWAIFIGWVTYRDSRTFWIIVFLFVFVFAFLNTFLSTTHLAPFPSFLLDHKYEGSGKLSFRWRSPGKLSTAKVRLSWVTGFFPLRFHKPPASTKKRKQQQMTLQVTVMIMPVIIFIIKIYAYPHRALPFPPSLGGCWVSHPPD